MSFRALASELRAHVTVWWHVRQQLRGDSGWPFTQSGLPGVVQDALAGLWGTFDDAVASALTLFPRAEDPEPDARLAVAEGWAPGGPEEAELERLEAITYSFADVLPIKAAAFVADHPGDFPAAPA